jgi:hypothetical protein
MSARRTMTMAVLLIAAVSIVENRRRGEKQNSEFRSQEPEEKKICGSDFILFILASGF